MYRHNIKQSQARHAYENFIVFANTWLPKIWHLTKRDEKGWQFQHFDLWPTSQNKNLSFQWFLQPKNWQLKNSLFNTFSLIHIVSKLFPTNNLHTCYKPSPKSWTLACKETNLKPKQLFGNELYTYTSTVGCNNSSCLAHILHAPTRSLIHAKEI